MRNNVDRLVFLLAGSGLSTRDLFDALSQLQRTSPHEIIGRVEQVRSLFVGGYSVVGHLELNDAALSQHERGLVAQIARLLLQESGLGPTMAAEQLRRSILSTPNSERVVPALRSKEGFSAWVRRVAKTVPASELLHHATKVRNEALHEKPSDWPLRDRR